MEWDFYNIIEPSPSGAPDFLPADKHELAVLGADTVDFVFVTGDAYVDHPSFGAAQIGKLLWTRGYKVGIIARPDVSRMNWPELFGRPRLGFLISSGNVDSMVNNYTVAKKRRTTTDVYAERGYTSRRPDRALTVYSKAVRRRFDDIPIILGGLEASLRRLAHYDYWSGHVMPSVLIDAEADLLVYGMGERQICEIADGLNAGIPVSALRYINGTVYLSQTLDDTDDMLRLPDFNEIKSDKPKYARSFKIQYENTDYINAKTLAEKTGSLFVVQNPPAIPLTEAELDFVYSLNYAMAAHPMYKDGVPSIEEVKFSLTSSRGCFGACNFCALAFHQGRRVTARSHQSILAEAERMTHTPGFAGYIHDVGGPTANFRAPACEKQKKTGVCRDKRCLSPEPCRNLDVSHADYLALLRKLRALPGIKKVFVRSGVRFDYVMLDNDGAFFNDLVEHHISGQLKTAPEHVSENVLRLMGKPPRKIYDAFVKKFKLLNKKHNKNQFIVPYLMSSHPGSTLKEAVELAEYLRDEGITPEQVQDFYPTPGTVSTCMYHTGINPLTGERVYTAKTPKEKAMQRALIQYKNPNNHSLVYEALIKAGRSDLIGFGKRCLIRPLRGAGQRAEESSHAQKSANKQRSAGVGRKYKKPSGRDSER